MAKIGYIKLHRKIQDNPFWRQPRIFSKAEAWIDILMEVRWSEEPDTVVIKNTVLVCNRGESLNSYGTWADRWNWTISAVRRFLLLLQSMNQIELVNEQQTTRLSVVNYKTYQDERNADETQMKRKRKANESQMKTEEEGKEGKKVKKDIYCEFVKLTKDEYQKLIVKLGEITTQEYIERLNNYLGSKGKKYASHYHTILNWWNKDQKETPRKDYQKKQPDKRTDIQKQIDDLLEKNAPYPDDPMFEEMGWAPCDAYGNLIEKGK